MKKRVVSIMLSIALLLVLIPPDLAAAADDHANTLGSSATFINLNSTVSGVISPNTDVDWFRFSLPAAGSITIASTVSGGLDSYGYLYSSSQSLIASNDDLNGRAFGMSVNLPIGTYYIKVASYNGTSSGSYTLRITGTASSAGTSTPTPATTTSGGSATINPGAARSISVYSGVTGRVRISTTATVTGTYIFTSSGNGSYDPAAYNSNSSSASRIADDEAGSSNFRLSVNLSAGQAYSFYAGTYGNGAASYVVSVTAPATVYTYTVSYNANGGSGAPASQTKTQNAGLTLSSVRPTRSGYAFLGWSTGSAATSASYQPGGSYTANANVMLYAVWQAQAAASGAMTAIGAGSRTVSVVAGAPTRFAFTPPTTGTYTFSTSNNSGDPYLYLYSSSAMTSAYLLTSNDDISSSDRNSRISYNLNAGVTYYIGAGAYSNGAATYILTISGTAATVTYTVSYSANGGSGAPASQTKTQNVSLTLSSVRPTRSGYTFLGWSTSSAAASASYQPGGSYTANAGITLYAVWQTATAASAITAIGTGSRTVSVVAGTPTRFAFTPSTTGTYTFSTSSNSGDPKLYLYSNSAMTSAYLLVENDDYNGNLNSYILRSLTAGVTYYIGAGAYNNGAATYTLTIAGSSAAATYTVSYNANGGSGAPASQTKTQNVSLTLSSVRPTRSGYNFLGWSTSSAATSASYQPGTAFTVNANTTLYAVWQASTVTITWNTNGASIPPVNVVKTPGTAIGTLPVPARTNYTFAGWFTAASGGTQITASSAVPAVNTIYYARWISSVTITWNANGGSGVSSQTKTVGNAMGTLPTTVRTGYTLNGWYTASSGGTKISASTAVPTGNATYYAQWAIKYVTVTWNANGGSVSPTSASKQEGTALGTLPTPTRTGYTFNGWYTASSGGTKISTSTIVPSSSVTYYAQWTAKTVTITWNANGGSVSPTSAVKQVGTTLGTLPTPTRTGYTFNGWYTSSSGGTKISVSTAVPSSNIIYYAQWAVKYVTVTWNANGGNVSSTSASKQEGTVLGTLPTPTRTGYTFNGWYTASSGGTKISGNTVTTSNVTYYAQWTAKTVTITWNAGNGSVSVTSSVKTAGTALGTLPISTVPNLKLDGWYTSSTGGTKISSSTLAPSTNTTYYARWDLSAENIMINLLTEQLKAKLSSAAKHITNPVRLKDVERGVIASVLRNAIDSAVVPTALLLDIIESIPKTYFSAEFYKAHMNNSAKIIESLANQSTYKDSFYVGMTIGDVAIMAVGVGATAKGITAIIEGIFVGVGGTVGSGLLGGVIAIPAGVALSVEGSITLGVGAVVFLTAADKFWNDIGMADNSSNGPFIGDEDGIPPGSEVKWPDNDGLDGTPWNHPFKKGETFGRYNLPGYERGGKFAAKTGTPFSERSLPHPKSSYDYHEYEVLRPFNSEAGYTAPWFGRKGGGLQYKLPLDIDMLIDQQYIKKLF